MSRAIHAQELTEVDRQRIERAAEWLDAMDAESDYMPVLRSPSGHRIEPRFVREMDQEESRHCRRSSPTF
ncbi:MAG TPA: hypothetical protein PLS03_09345 [Terrimicrobiaceae bacterium]|nr:hypothetical protein [Terrimicrobiaceae bacterium]